MSRQAVHVLPPEPLAELPRGDVAAPDRARFALLDKRVQRLQRFFQKGRVIPLVKLIQVHPVGAQAAQTGLSSRHNARSGEGRPHLGGQDHRISGAAIGQPPAHDIFGEALAVGFRGIPQGDADFSGAIHDRERGRFIDLPPKSHTAKPHRTDAQLRSAQDAILHAVLTHPR
jgi:hypothetical protein